MSLSLKLNYLFQSISNYFQPAECPYCGGNEYTIIDRKYIFTMLAECRSCHLRFRLPRDPPNNNEYFYNSHYKQEDGITTDLPDTEELDRLIATKFSFTNKNIRIATQIFESLSGSISGKSLLDYGCSWGYMTWQFNDIGIKAIGYEIGKKRVAFGRERLGVEIITDKEFLPGNLDFIFSSHLIEHLDDIHEFVEISLEKLKKDGFLVIVCPNGSADLQQAVPEVFHRFWGKVHPNLINDKFYMNIFGSYPFYIESSSYNFGEIRNWDQKSQKVRLNGGDELLCIVKKVD